MWNIKKGKAKMIQIGIQHSGTLEITNNLTAKSIGSGGLDVLATPVIINLMEKTAWESVLPFMEADCDTVGTFVEINHIAPTPVGSEISCTSILTNIRGRELTFEIEVFDNKEKIAYATHKRFIIKKEPFQQKANNKLLVNK